MSRPVAIIVCCVGVAGCGDPVTSPAPRSATAVRDEPLPKRRSRCPEGAVWTGRICRGPGFTACPGDAHLEADACKANDAPSVTPKPTFSARPRRAPKVEDPDEEEVEVPPISTTIPECDRFMRRSAACHSLTAVQPAVIEGLVKAYSMARDPKRRASTLQLCVQMDQTLKATCP